VQQGWQEILEGVAVGEHEAGDVLGVPGDHELADSAAGVVADQGDVAQLRGRQEIGDEPGQTGRAKVGVGIHRHQVRAGQQIPDDAAESLRERRHDIAPVIPIHQEPVHEYDRLTLPHVAVPDKALTKPNLLDLAGYQGLTHATYLPAITYAVCLRCKYIGLGVSCQGVFGRNLWRCGGSVVDSRWSGVWVTWAGVDR
jgi:hypothetical protein